MDIKRFFDEVDHELMLKALDRHVEEKWVKMYVSRWLEAPVETKQGERITKHGKGTPHPGRSINAVELRSILNKSVSSG